MTNRKITLSYRIWGNQWQFACETSEFATCRDAKAHYCELHNLAPHTVKARFNVHSVKPRWKYCGDMNPENGGFWWREDSPKDSSYVYAVEVIPLSDLGGPDCAFIVDGGSIHIGNDAEMIAEFHQIIGFEPEAGTLKSEIRRATVEGARAYRGIESDSKTIVQIGKLSQYDPEYPHGFNGPDTVLRGNSSLARYIRREFLR